MNAVEKYRAIQRDIHRLQSEIKRLETEQTQLKLEMPTLYYIDAYERDDRPIAGGIHLVAKTFEECEAWLKENYGFITDSSGQFYPEYEHDWNYGHVYKRTPVDEGWNEILALFMSQSIRS